MPDAARQLQSLYVQGFEMETFERYPRAVGVRSGGCIVLLEATPGGLRMIGTPGWRMGEVMGLLVEVDGLKVFQAKGVLVAATPERLAELEEFRRRIELALTSEL